jgi:hypothetical protein
LDFNLRMLNLWIGLAEGVAGLPSDIHYLGYRVHSIEGRFPNQDNDLVHPEVTLVSAPEEHTLLVESKSGKNTDADQLDRYARIDGSDLVQRAYIAPDGAKAHDVTIVGDEQHEATLAKGIADGGHSFPLLLATATGLALRLNDFEVASLTATFTPELAIDWTQSPTAFVPIDGESQVWEAAAIVLPAVVSQMTIGATSVLVTQLAMNVCPLTWKLLGTPGRQAISAKVASVLEEAGANEFAGILKWDSQGVGKVDIERGLPTEDQAAYTRMMKDLGKRTGDLVGRLRAAATQPHLFPPDEST